MDLGSIKTEKRPPEIFELYDELFLEAVSDVCFDVYEFLGHIGSHTGANYRECRCGSVLT